MPPPPPIPAWDEASLLGVCAQAASLAARLTRGFAGVSWLTYRDGQSGEWLIAAVAEPEWRLAGSATPHPWSAHEPLLRIPIPGAAALTLVAARHEDATDLLEVAALLSAGSLTTTAPRLRQLLESTPDGVFLLDRGWRFTYVNQRGAALLNHTPESLLGRVVWESFPEAIDSRFQRVYERVFATGEPEQFEEYFAPLVTWFQVDAFMSGEELCVHYRDVTAQRVERDRLRRVEEELRQALERLRRIADESQDLICTWTLDGRYQTANQAVKRILGYEPEEFRGLPILDLIVEEDRAASSEAVRSVAGGRPLASFRNRLRHKNGRIVHMEWSSVWSVEDNVGFAIARDRTNQQEAEDRLRESEQRYRLVFDENPQQMWMYDDETYQMLAVNEAALTNYGYTREEFLRLTVFDLVHPDELELARTRLITNRQPGSRSGIWLHQRKDGKPIVIQGWSHPMPFQGRPTRLSVAIDITRQRGLEEQLRQAQKMEAVGELAGGIAHDFNNFLTVINGYASMGRVRAQETEYAGMFEAIEQAGARAAQLTQQLLAFSRRQVLQPEVIDLNQVVANIQPMLKRAVPEQVELVVQHAGSLQAVRADAAQIEQVLLNLVLNARDAMEGRGGRIVIETANVTLDQSYVSTHPDAQAGPHVLLSVTDSGHGMDAATVARVFEPFFTTKERGRGTGLGLPMAYGIIKQSGGHIAVYSETGAGTSMKVYLPAVEPAGESTATALTEGSAGAQAGQETILLVEDDERVREFTRVVLEGLGYTVLEAEDGRAALAAAASAGEIDLLITDVVLPRLSGREVARRLAPLRPRMKVLFVSGYTENAIVHEGALDAGLNYLPKPYRPDALAHKVREVLDHPLRPRCILLVAAAGRQRADLDELLRSAGYDIILASTGAEALKATRRRAVDLILSTLELPGYAPAETVEFFREELPHVPVAALAEPSAEVRADTFVAPGEQPDLLIQTIRSLIG